MSLNWKEIAVGKEKQEIIEQNQKIFEEFLNEQNLSGKGRSQVRKAFVSLSRQYGRWCGRCLWPK